METKLRILLRWLPRALAIAFALFLSLFALDVFNEHRGVIETAIALLIHLLPVWLVLGALAVAWRWEAAGGVLFLGLAAWYIVMATGKPGMWYVVIAGPPIVIGLLFLLSAWFRGPRLRAAGTVAGR